MLQEAIAYKWEQNCKILKGKKTPTLKAPHKIIAATPIWESEFEFTKFMRTSTQIISVLE